MGQVLHTRHFSLINIQARATKEYECYWHCSNDIIIAEEVSSGGHIARVCLVLLRNSIFVLHSSLYTHCAGGEWEMALPTFERRAKGSPTFVHFLSSHHLYLNRCCSSVVMNVCRLSSSRQYYNPMPFKIAVNTSFVGGFLPKM